MKSNFDKANDYLDGLTDEPGVDEGTCRFLEGLAFELKERGYNCILSFDGKWYISIEPSRKPAALVYVQGSSCSVDLQVIYCGKIITINDYYVDELIKLLEGK